MVTLHIHASPWQPLTSYWDQDLLIHTNPRRVFRCHECRDWRWASKLKIQAYYDMVIVRCADGCYGARKKGEGE